MQEQVQLQLETQKTELASLSIKDIFYKYVRFLPLFIISIALALFGAYLYLRYTTPTYQSIASLQIRDDNQQRGTDELSELLMPQGTNNIQSEIEFIRSRPLMERVVKALDLNFTYFGVGKIAETNFYKYCPFRVEALKLTDSSSFTLNLTFPSNHAFRVNDDNTLYSFGQTFSTPNGVFRLIRKNTGNVGTEYRVTWENTSSVASRLVSGLTVSPKGQNTGIILISLESTNPQLSADVVNRLMIEYQNQTIEDKNENTFRTKQFIEERLDTIERDLNNVTSRLLSFQQANNLIDIEAQSSSYFTRADESQRMINEQSAQLEVVRLIENYLHDKRNNFNTVPSSLGLNDPTLNTLINAYNVAQLERKDLIEANVPRGNPAVQEKEAMTETLRQRILSSLSNVRKAITTSISDLQSKNATVQAQLRSLPAKQQNYLEIQREQQTKQAVYNLLLEKNEESAIALAATISNSKVLEQAMPNGTPVKPNRRNTQLLALFIGFLLPGLFILGVEVLNDKVTTRNDIERITTATILGEVGHSYSNETLVVKSNNRSVVAEQFRIIRSNLQYVLSNIQKPVILVTSSFSGEGKSFVSTNIGAVMALTGKKTIILEFDIRKPKILSQLNMGKKPGVTNYLIGKASLEDLPIPVPETENLYVLPCGPVPPNPAELLLESRLNDLIAYLKNNFDVIVMDTAPVGMVSDAMTLSKFADCTLYIVRQGYTYKRQIALIDEFHQQKKLPRISLVVNDVKAHGGYGYYGYGKYGYGGYGYGYTSGYFDDDTPPPTLLSKWFGWMDIKKWKKNKAKRRRR